MRIFSHILKKTARYCFVVLGFFCFSFAILYFHKVNASPADTLKEDLHQQIDALQSQIDAYRANIKDLQQESKTLKREISLLDSKIKTAELEIKQIDLSIEETEQEIADRDLGLGQAESELDRERVILTEYLRLVNEYDQEDFIETILSNEKLSDVFDRLNSLESVQEKIQESMTSIQDLKMALETERQALEEKREELNQLKVLQRIQSRSIVLEQEDKENLLTQTKGQESNFQNLIAKAKSDVDSIKKQLYLLEGIGLAMPLEQAYQYAKMAANLTGVRPAFLLAVLKKESSWGEEVGTGTWRRDMNPKDQKAFIEICEKLNLNPDKTPVSHKPSYGWGGAMGPAQFLPSVWLSCEDQVANLTGHYPPNPWDIEDSFVAAALKLSRAGANIRLEDAEWKAAQIYFAGKNWNKPAYYFYGDQVMELAGIIQDQLNLIAG